MVELTGVCKYAIAVMALAFIAVYGLVAVNHLFYPFEIEVTEGQALEQVKISHTGKQFYVPPSLEFTPFIYMPFYYYLNAALLKIFRYDFATLRMVSFLASLGCMWLIYLIVKRHSESRFAGIVAAGLFAATYEASGVWMDITRVDSVFLFFVLASIYFLCRGSAWNFQLMAGIMLWLSFLTKQTAALIAIFLFVYAVIAFGKRSFIFIGTVLLLSAVSLFLLNVASDGWFMVYFFLPFQHEIEQRFYLDFWKQDIAAVAIALPFAAYYLATKRHFLKNIFLYAFLGMVAASWASRLHRGGWNNALFPAYAIIAIVCCLGVAKLMHNGDARRKTAICLLLAVQFALLAYNPFAYVPSSGSVEAGNFLLDILSQYPDPVFIPNHPYLLSRLGKQSHAHSLTLWDFFRTRDKTRGDELQEDIKKALRERRFSAIILDNELFSFNHPWFVDVLNENYVMNQTLFENENVLWTVSGVRTRPQFVYVPKAT